MMTVRRRDLPAFHDAQAVQAELERRQRAADLAELQLAAASENQPGDSHWYTLRVRPRSELGVKNLLKEKNIECFVPMRKIKIKRQRRRKSIEKIVPVFEGYIFINVVPSNAAFAGLLSLEKVDYLLGDSDGPLPIPERNLAEFNKLLERRVLDHGADLARTRYARAGEYGMVTDGPFEWQKVFVKAWRGKQDGDEAGTCLAVLVGTKFTLKLDIDSVERLD